MGFEESEGHLVGGALYLLWPEVVVIVVAAETGDADADGVLCSGDVAVFALGVFLGLLHNSFLQIFSQVGAYFRGYMVGCYLGHVVLYHDFDELLE